MPAVVYSAPVNTAVVLWNNVLLARRVADPSLGNRVNMSDPATWSMFAPSGTNVNVDYDIGREINLDSFGLAAHTLGTSGVSVKLQYSTNGTTWLDAFSTYAPLTNEDIFFLFPKVSGRYFRINFTGSGFTVGIAMAGVALKFPHSPLDGYTPLHHARKYTKLFNDSIKGQFLGNRVLAAGAETSVDLGFMDRVWFENNIRGFESHFNQGGTFFYAGCPSKYPLDMGYCRAAGDDGVLDITWTERDKMAELSFSIQSYVG